MFLLSVGCKWKAFTVKETVFDGCSLKNKLKKSGKIDSFQ